MNHITPNFSAETAALDPARLVGQVRRFGTYGVLYEILERVDDAKFKIRVLDTGEELAYPLTKIVLDPRD